MIEREWISVTDPGDPHDRYLFDVTFLLSDYTCIYGAGCQGIRETADTVVGCCAYGAHFLDAEDRDKVVAMVDRLGPGYLQAYAEVKRRGVVARTPDGEERTRVRDGACIFQNRADWPGGAGCALHQYAVDRGEHHMTYKPEVCWIVPLRRIVEEDTADDGEPMWVTTITSYDRGGWGAGGSDFGWWCTESAEAFVGERPVYRSMEAELRAMSSDAVYEELAGYLDDRRRRARKPLPFPLYVR